MQEMHWWNEKSWGRAVNKQRAEKDRRWNKGEREKRRGIMGIERQTLTRLISAPAVYPQFLSWTLKIYMEGKTYRVKSEQDIQEWKSGGHSGGKLMEGGIKKLDSKKKEFWRKVESTGDGLPSERNSMKKASLMWDPLPTTTTTPGYNCLPHFTSENRQASPLFLPSLSFSFSLSFSSPRPHIRFSSNTLTLSLLVEYEPTRALTLSHAFDKKHI